MAPAFLIAGATGNTGRSVIAYLPDLVKDTSLSSHRIIALTRSVNSAAAKELAKIPGVEVVGENWVEITKEWLIEHEVERVFIASHNEPNQFAEEGQFLVNLLRAGVKYVVRISTVAAAVRPAEVAYYPRTHWAIETMLRQPEFKALQWTSLQPNLFAGLALMPAIRFIMEYKQTGKQGTLSSPLHQTVGQGVIDPYEVGIVAAHLLAKENTTPHDQARYVLNGPEDVNGKDIKKLVEAIIGVKVQNAVYQELSFIDQMAEHTTQSKNLILSLKHAPAKWWEGKAKASTTSKEVLELFAPKRTVADVLREMLAA